MDRERARTPHEEGRALSRRRFVTASAMAGATAALAASVGLVACSPKQKEGEDEPQADEGAQQAGVSTAGYQYAAESAEGVWRHSACSRNCFDTCMIRSKVADGQLVAVRGDSDNPYTKGGLCVKTQNYVDYVYREDRLLYPMRRTGTKGPGCTFERIGWDEAIQAVTDRWKQIIAENGPEAITWFRYQGNQGALNRRCLEPLFYRMGATYHEASLCNNGYVGMLDYVTGTIAQMRPEDIPAKSLYVSWSHNECASSLHLVKFIKEMHAAGGTIVVVNPTHTPLVEWADLVVRPLPGTDSALALGVANHLIQNDMLDQDFIDRYGIGFDDYRASAAEWTPERVAEVCRIPEGQVAELAQLLWDNRTSTCLKVGLQLGRRTNGGMSHIGVKLLPVVVGHPESYLEMTSSGGWSVNLTAGLDLFKEKVPSESSSASTIRNYSSPALGKVLTGVNYGEGHDFATNPIRSIFIFGANPMVSNPNQNLVREGLEREDLFTVVSEVFVTPTAEYADILLPAPTSFEYEEYNTGYGHNYDCFNEQVIEPLGECKPNWEVNNLLGQAMGYDEPEFKRTMDDFRAMMIEAKSYSFEELAEKGWFDVQPKAWETQLEEGFPTKSGKLQFASDELLADHGTRTAVYTPDSESEEGAPELFFAYPLALLSPNAKEFLNGCFGNMEDNNILFEENHVLLSPADASARGIAEGDPVRVYNDRGEVRRRARIMDGAVKEGTAVSYKSTWPAMTGEANINCLTTDEQADFGRGVSYQSCLVDVAKA
ncbi:MAG: molybdopterin-dependent oxidoreductase [Coriobacteriales bacterium]|nr:molybdopterin-dependent oxidoreductase [Coriobacteriales bacterium]